MLPLVACQREGMIQRVDGWERPEPFGAASAAGGQHDTGLPVRLPLGIDGGAPPSSGGSFARTRDVSFADGAAGHSGGSATGPTGRFDIPEPRGTDTAVTVGLLGISEPRGGEHREDASAAPAAPVPEAATTGGGPTGHARDNATAADLLDHWGHRRVQGLVEGLSLRSPDPDADAADFKALHAAASATPDLPVGDEVRILGTRRGVTYGRWTAGPADTLSITFDLSAAGPVTWRYPDFRATVERAGKAWSHRIADTWAAWRRYEGEFKGWLIDGDDSHTRVYVGAGGEVSTGLRIDIRDDDIPRDFAGWAQLGHGPPGASLEPRFAPLEIDRDYLRNYPRRAGDSSLFATLAHEIGHTLGAWYGGEFTHRYAPFTDTEAGTWTGPNVVALHGGPAPFQDAADPDAWVDGERSPLATQFDFHHSGVCVSLMAYCGDNAPRPAYRPHDIDFAFLADLGMTIREDTGDPETYGLAGWTRHAGFTLAVSRDLRIGLGAESGSGRRYRNQRPLDVTDRFQVEANAFGFRSTGSLARSYPATDLSGTARFAGGLIGAAIDRASMPPVTGDAALAVNLGTLDGTASFTSLAVHTRGVSRTFAGGALHYPFALDGNAIVGTHTSATLRGDFYGTGHQDAAGTLHDPDAGLLASFGTTHDDRPGREAVDPTDPEPRVSGASDAARAPTASLEGIRHIGTGIAPEAGTLASAGERNGIAVSSGEVRDGASAERVIEYLETQTGGDGSGRRTTGLPTFAEPPTLRFAAGTGKEAIAYVTRAVDVVNAALPADRRIVISPARLPPRTAIGNVPDGQIFVDFTPTADASNPEDDGGRFAVSSQVDPNSEYDSVTQRWEFRSMRAARVSADGRDFMTTLRTASVRNPDTGDWEKEVLDSPVVETGVVRKYYSEESLNAVMVGRLLYAMGFLRRLDQDRFPDSFLAQARTVDTHLLPTIDGDALLAAYGRLEPGTEPEALSPDSLGPWSDSSFHLRGDMAAPGGPASFGVALRNGLARPWAFGPEPLARLADNTALYGTATWDGALAGITPERQTVAGDARLAVEIATLEGQLDFTDLERWGERAAPGAPGTGTTWGDGDLGYSVRVEDNAFVATGGDEGEVTGAFFGRAHEAMGGVLRRSDLSAGFGGVR